jgi:hypothetical protein
MEDLKSKATQFFKENKKPIMIVGGFIVLVIVLSIFG